MIQTEVQLGRDLHYAPRENEQREVSWQTLRTTSPEVFPIPGAMIHTRTRQDDYERLSIKEALTKRITSCEESQSAVDCPITEALQDGEAFQEVVR